MLIWCNEPRFQFLQSSGMSSELDLSSLKIKDDLKLKEVELFGGAMTMLMPAMFVDVSDFRQIPDTQVDPATLCSVMS